MSTRKPAELSPPEFMSLLASQLYATPRENELLITAHRAHRCPMIVADIGSNSMRVDYQKNEIEVRSADTLIAGAPSIYSGITLEHACLALRRFFQTRSMSSPAHPASR